MKTLLTRLTLGGVAAVVVVLAYYLIAIVVVLYRANRNLADVVEALDATRKNTGELSGDMAAINGAAVSLQTKLQAVNANLSAIVNGVKG